jgi:hypothetical protein
MVADKEEDATTPKVVEVVAEVDEPKKAGADAGGDEEPKKADGGAGDKGPKQGGSGAGGDSSASADTLQAAKDRALGLADSMLKSIETEKVRGWIKTVERAGLTVRRLSVCRFMYTRPSPRNAEAGAAAAAVAPVRPVIARTTGAGGAGGPRSGGHPAPEAVSRTRACPRMIVRSR